VVNPLYALRYAGAGPLPEALQPGATVFSVDRWGRVPADARNAAGPAALKAGRRAAPATAHAGPCPTPPPVHTRKSEHQTHTHAHTQPTSAAHLLAPAARLADFVLPEELRVRGYDAGAEDEESPLEAQFSDDEEVGGGRCWFQTPSPWQEGR
jgi:hypothetical protein